MAPLTDLTLLVILENVTNLAKFRQIVQRMQISLTWKPAMLTDLFILSNLANVTNLAKFRPITEYMQIS